MTFFFNGGLEAAFPQEDRLMVPSPKVATYDLQPEMSAAGVAQSVSVIGQLQHNINDSTVVDGGGHGNGEIPFCNV